MEDNANCKYCTDDESIFYSEKQSSYILRVEGYHWDEYNDRIEDHTDVEIKFCPFCGRSLEKPTFDYYSSD